jgi:hypothetical protein
VDKKELYSEWKKLVNMSPGEIEDFLDEWGDVAGLSRAQAKKEGVRSGRDSARAIIRMKDKGKLNWNANDWKWAQRQVAFIKRFTSPARTKSGRKPYNKLYDKDGYPTRYLLALLVWGHDPEKK